MLPGLYIELTCINGTENTSFPNFDILDHKTLKYVSQPIADQKTFVRSTNVSLTTLTFPTI